MACEFDTTEQLYSLLIYDGNTKKTVEVRLELPEGTKYQECYWTSENEIAIVSEDHRSFIICTLMEHNG